MHFKLFQGDCLTVLRGLPANSIDSICTDPPYGLSFMGHHWDYDVPGVEVWREALRVLKPGGHLLSFAGSRTYHRMAVNIEDAGFEIRDQIMWVYGSGFPKSMDVSKAIDKAAGAEREILGVVDPRGTFDGKERSSAAINTNWRSAEGREDVRDLSRKVLSAPATDAARQWQGWGTALKPAHEPIVVARKPLSEKTVVANVLTHGTGALNIDASRVPLTGPADSAQFENNHRVTERLPQAYEGEPLGLHDGGWKQRVGEAVIPTGRWPANLIHDGSDEVISAFPANAGAAAPVKGTEFSVASKGDVTYGFRERVRGAFHNDSGSAARFFYAAKASKKDRGEGNNHPTVKPVAVCLYLQRLVTPPGGTTLDMYCGSGSFGVSAMQAGFDFIGIDKDEDEHGNSLGYLDISARRIARAQAEAFDNEGGL